jgi:AraC-like DNA-binding protein
MPRNGENQGRLFRVREESLPHFGLKRAVEFIHQHYQEKLCLDAIAGQACLSKYHFCRLFHRIIGMPYQEYVTAVRIEKAKELLKETPFHSITQIGYEIGIGGLRNFETRFKQLTGQTPYQYRKELSSEEQFRS